MLAFLQTIVHILISLEVIPKQPKGESTERNTNEVEIAALQARKLVLSVLSSWTSTLSLSTL